MKNRNRSRGFSMSLAAVTCVLITACGGTGQNSGAGSVTLTNVSYDPTREFYREFNAAFSDQWEAEHGVPVHVNMSH